MKNHKQLLADFYLALLAWSNDPEFVCFELMNNVRDSLAFILKEEPETIQRIFEQMAAEDASSN